MLANCPISALVGTRTPDACPLPVSSSTHWFKTDGVLGVVESRFASVPVPVGGLRGPLTGDIADNKLEFRDGELAWVRVDRDAGAVVMTSRPADQSISSGRARLCRRGTWVEPMNGIRNFELKDWTGAESLYCLRPRKSLRYNIPARTPVPVTATEPGGE